MTDINQRILKIIGDDSRTFNEIYEAFMCVYDEMSFSNFLENMIKKGIIKRTTYSTIGKGIEFLYTKVQPAKAQDIRFSLIDQEIENQMQPVTWTRPKENGANIKMMNKILLDLKKWGKKNLPKGEVKQSFDLALEDIMSLQVACVQEFNETLKMFCLHSAPMNIPVAQETVN